MERAVRKATKLTLAAPKQKHIQVLIGYIHAQGSLDDLFRQLQGRIREPSWMIVFKALIVVHTLVREGSNDRILAHLSANTYILNVSGFKERMGSSGVEQAKNLHAYAAYLEEKAGVYRDLHIDFVKSKSQSGSSRLKSLSLSNGLLRETTILQRQISALLNCKFYLDEVDNDITLEAFRLLIKDLLRLFQVVNEGVINILKHYFEMSKPDAKNALQIYKVFTKQTEGIVDYLNVARKLQEATRINIPQLKHAPTSLASLLEEYINSPDYEEARKEYQKSKNSISSSQSDNDASKTQSQKPNRISANISSFANEPPKDIIDFFSSIEQEQTTVFASPSSFLPLHNIDGEYLGPPTSQLTGLAIPFTPVPAQLTGDTNPFRQSVLTPQMTGMILPQQTGLNPYGNVQFQQPMSQTPLQLQYTGQLMLPQSTGQNLFSNQLQPQLTGSNPYSQNAQFHNFQPHDFQSKAQLQPQITGYNTPNLFQLQPQPTGTNPFQSTEQPTSLTQFQQFGGNSSGFPLQQDPAHMDSYSPSNPFSVPTATSMSHQLAQQNFNGTSFTGYQ